MRRALLCLLLLTASARADAEEPTRLGLLVRWWLDEPSPARRAGFIEAMDQMTKGDVGAVIAAIRRGEHLQYPAAPALLQGGRLPEFALDRPRVLKIAEAAGDVARLTLPEGYDRSRAYPLVAQLGAFNLEVPAGAVLLQVEPERHPQARDKAWAAEALTLSLIAHVAQIVHVDPDRVFLRGEGKMAELAWAVALHNPDRFAGVLGARGVWSNGARLAPNAGTFCGVLIERRKGNPRMAPFFAAMRAQNPGHLFLRAPREPALDAQVLLPTIRAWWGRTLRPAAPERLVLVADRDVRLRSFWLEVSPRTRSEKRQPIARQWEERFLIRDARLEAEIKADNLVVVTAARATVKSFTIFIDPRRFDVAKPLRVRVNGAPAPEARLIRPDLETMLTDYAARRDPGLLYLASETFRP